MSILFTYQPWANREELGANMPLVANPSGLQCGKIVACLSMHAELWAIFLF